MAGSCDLLEVERLYAEFNQVIGSVEQTNCPIVMSDPAPTLFGGKGFNLLFIPEPIAPLLTRHLAISASQSISSALKENA